ncbi:MAG: hypothetical protein H0T51_00445 [Pirellulales bacterium]|nr:hypothetical protein [Pirellulales bacterium]
MSTPRFQYSLRMALLVTTFVAIVAALLAWLRELRVVDLDFRHPEWMEWVVGCSAAVGTILLFVFALACAISGRPPLLASLMCLLVGSLLVMRFIQLARDGDQQPDEEGFALVLGVILVGRGAQLLHRNLTRSEAAESGESAEDAIDEAGRV